MIVYVDSSLLASALLPAAAASKAVVEELLAGGDVLVTGFWTRIEVSGAIVRAGRLLPARRRALTTKRLLAALDGELDVGGRVALVRASQAEVDDGALAIVRSEGIRAMDAWHLATAAIVLPLLGPIGDGHLFATADASQAAVAARMGFRVL